MFEEVTTILLGEPRIDYALVFGSMARGSAHPESDLDLAIGLSEPMTTREILDLSASLQSACGREVDLISMSEAPPALAYRVFEGGEVLFERDHSALVDRKTRAILDYIDFKPIEDILVRGVLSAAKDG